MKWQRFVGVGINTTYSCTSEFDIWFIGLTSRSWNTSGFSCNSLEGWRWKHTLALSCLHKIIQKPTDANCQVDWQYWLFLHFEGPLVWEYEHRPTLKRDHFFKEMNHLPSIRLSGDLFVCGEGNIFSLRSFTFELGLDLQNPVCQPMFEMALVSTPPWYQVVIRCDRTPELFFPCLEPSGPRADEKDVVKCECLAPQWFWQQHRQRQFWHV